MDGDPERMKGSALTRATDDPRPPSGSYRETYRRHRRLCFVPVVLGAVAAAFILFSSAHSYRSTASIWVDTAGSVASSVGADGSPALAEPPASSEQGVLTELLSTDSFADSVARSSVLGKDLGSAAAIDAHAPALLQHGHVTSAPTGGQVLKITYTGSSPALAESVLGGVVTQLRNYSDSFASQHEEAAVTYDREQVSLAQATLAAENKSVRAYVAQHGRASRSAPAYIALAAAQNNAVTELGQANATLNQASASRGTDGWTLRVIDPPGPAVSQAPDKKKIVGVILGGAFAGLLVSLLAVIAFTPARKETWEDERPYEGLPGPMAPSTGPLLGPLAGQGDASHKLGPLLTPTGLSHKALATAGERLFTFGPLSEEMDEP